MELVWTTLARDSYVEVVKNLEKYWTTEIVNQFILLTDETLIHLKNELIIHKPSQIIDGINQAIIHKNISLYYLINKNDIVLITFYENRMNPTRLDSILKNPL